MAAAAAAAAGATSPARQHSAVAVTSGSSSSVISSTSNVTPPIATASWASLSAVLPCIVQWWDNCRPPTGRDRVESRSVSVSSGHGGSDADGDEWDTEAESLARAVAAAYASAVEGGSKQNSLAEKKLTTAKAEVGRENKKTASRGRSGHAQAATAAAVHVPKRFASAVSTLSSVPCVQPELMRALRAVLDLFPRIPTAVLWQAELAGKGAQSRGLPVSAGGQHQEQHREIDESAQGRVMAPPPPRQPSGKKRGRVSLEYGALRAAAAGGDGCGDLGGALTSPRVSHHEGELRDGGGMRGLVSAPLVGQERPTVFSGDSAALEAIGAVLRRADAALEFFETEEVAWMGTDRGNGGGEASTSAGDSSAGKDRNKEYGSSAEHLHLILQHMASVTCAIRMLAPFVNRAQVVLPPGDDETGRRLEFGGSCYKRGPATRIPRSEKQGTHVEESSAVEGWPSLFGRLADGFAAAVRTIARYKADGSSGSHESGVGSKNRPPSVRSPRTVALLLDLAVNCATEIPTALLVSPAREKRGNAGGGTGDRGEAQARLLTTIDLVAETALRVIISPVSAVLDAAVREQGSGAPPSPRPVAPTAEVAASLWTRGLVDRFDGSIGGRSPKGLTGNVLEPAITSAPFPLKCYLLAAAVERERMLGGGVYHDAAGVDRAQGRRNKEEGSRGGDEEESRPKRRRVLGGNRSSDEGSSGGLEGTASLENCPVFSVEDALLSALRPDGNALVAQCAVAALPTLSLCSERCSDIGSGELTEHVEACHWRAQWLPALLSLSESGGSEEVRLELAAALLRMGSSLDSSRNDADNDQMPLPKQSLALGHPELPHSDRKNNMPYEAGPFAFTDLLPLWPKLLKDDSAAVRGAAARAALSAAAAAPLPRLKSAGAKGAIVLRLLTEMLACGDPEVAWAVAGGAGKFVADGGKILRAMYASGGGKEDEEGEEDQDENTLGAEEEKEQEGHFREVALSKFIETVGKMLQEHGDRLRHGRWQSLHDFTALLRALG